MAQAVKQRFSAGDAQKVIIRSYRKSMFIMEASFYTRGSGRYFAMHPTSLLSEMDFCNAWEEWNRKKVGEFALKSAFNWWIQELSTIINLEVADALQAYLYLDGALENNTPLLEIRLVLWDAFDSVSNRSH